MQTARQGLGGPGRTASPLCPLPVVGSASKGPVSLLTEVPAHRRTTLEVLGSFPLSLGLTSVNEPMPVVSRNYGRCVQTALYLAPPTHQALVATELPLPTSHMAWHLPSPPLCICQASPCGGDLGCFQFSWL